MRRLSRDACSRLLKRDGTLVLVGVPEPPHASPDIANLVFKRRAIADSPIGGAETRELLDVCADEAIVAGIEMIQAQAIDKACERMLKSDGKYRACAGSTPWRRRRSRVEYESVAPVARSAPARQVAAQSGAPRGGAAGLAAR